MYVECPGERPLAAVTGGRRQRSCAATPFQLRRLLEASSLAVVAVVLTTAAVAFLGWRFAGLPIAAAIALGAIVAPPDAVAANEVLRHLRIPQRIGLVLRGESLLNDATALLNLPRCRCRCRCRGSFRLFLLAIGS